MLKNALVNINRPGRQDKFAFMPEEEKTSVSLTQRPRRRVAVVANAACRCHTRQADVPGCWSAGQRRQTSGAAFFFLNVGHCDTSSLCVKCHNLMKMALRAPIRRRVGPATESPLESERCRRCANCRRGAAASCSAVPWNEKVASVHYKSRWWIFIILVFFSFSKQEQQEQNKQKRQIFRFNYIVLWQMCLRCLFSCFYIYSRSELFLRQHEILDI